MSRKDDSPAISLFSFQDIITSITGIMFLVVILLMLLFLEAEPPSSEQDNAAARQIAARIAELEAVLLKYQQQEKELEKILKELQAMSPEMIEERKNELEQKVLQQKNQLAQLKHSRENMKNSITYTEQEIERIKERIEKRQKELDNEKKSVASNRKNLENLEKQMESSRNAVTFSVEKNSDKRFFLAEFGKNGFRIKDFSNQVDHDLRQPGASDNEQIAKLISWLEKHSSSGEVVSVIMIPSKIKLWDAIAEKLRKLNIEFGVEFYPTDSSSIFTDLPEGEK